jgi:hypothetical protein
MNRERPTIILVMAILNFVFGAMCSVTQVCGLGSILLMRSLGSMPAPPTQKGMPMPNPFQEISTMYDYVPGFYVVSTTYAILTIVLHVVLIAAGIGLLSMKPWARWTCVVYSMVTILLVLANTVYTVQYVQPGIEKWQRDFLAKMAPGAPPPATMGNSPFVGSIGAAFGFIMYVAYPLALLIVMLLPMVGAAFAGKRSLPAPYDYDDRGGGPADLPPPDSSSGPSDPHFTPRRY